MSTSSYYVVENLIPNTAVCMYTYIFHSLLCLITGLLLIGSLSLSPFLSPFIHPSLPPLLTHSFIHSTYIT